MKVGLAVSSVVHIFAGVALFFLAAKFELPTPPDPSHVDIELEHGDGSRSNPGSSPENLPSSTLQGEQPPPPSPPPSQEPGQPPKKNEAPTNNDQLSQPRLGAPDTPPPTPLSLATQPEAEPVAPAPVPMVAPQQADPQPKAAPIQPPAKPVPPPQTQSARRPDPPMPRPSQPAPAPAPPQAKTELEVHLGDGVGLSQLRDGERPSQPEQTNGLPPYPSYAQSRGMQGTVELRFQVGTDGSVLSAEIMSSSGYPLLDSTAQNWIVRTYRFKPALRDGKPVLDIRQQKFIFVLE